MSENVTNPGLPDIPCKVNDFGIDGIPSQGQLNEFWDAYQPWLAERGILLYERHREDPHQLYMPREWVSPTFSSTSSLPYGALVYNQAQEEHRARFLYHAGSRLAFAQDALHRDLMLKLVDNGSAEHEIYQLILQDAPAFAKSTDFPCVLPARALSILNTPYAYSFVVMPMWGSPVHLKDMGTLGEVLTFIKCSLTGLRYLHRNRVAHRDICENNMVVNAYSPSLTGEEFARCLRQFRANNETFYALLDYYDQSLRLSQDVSLRNCRRPAQETWIGANPFKPADINLGEPYYNLFAFDVAALGLLFRYYFPEAVTTLPGLAALFDRMTDHRISHRLTAEEAVEFLNDFTAAVTPEMLKTHIVLKLSGKAMNVTDTYWDKLSPQEQLVWGPHRTPPRPLWQRLLDRITSYQVGWVVVCFIHRVLQV
ncbi:hypothetical protein OH77DRAFT_1424614 [Trametes cingulata]|nr:hypothetical protein OH77DRAFT_1424614 [Trametes cingulata]